jgi:hypothetical protein
VTGSFYLRPERPLWVCPAKATIFSGSVAIGSETLLNQVSVAPSCTIPPFDPRPPLHIEVFRIIAGNVYLSDSSRASMGKNDWEKTQRNRRE